MTPFDRRGLLRLAAIGAAGSLASACSDGATPQVTSDSRPSVGGTAAKPAATVPSPGEAVAGAVPPLAAGLPFQVSGGPLDRPQVALTFHGQGDPAIAASLLGEAERAGARVTVLAVGSWLDAQPAMARRILDGGHELGNHTQNHRAISAMTPDQAYAEIAGCAERLRRLTGGIGRWFRPSQTQDCTPTVAAQARRAGYAHCLGYNLDSLDYTDPGVNSVTRTVLSAIVPGSVVSLHFGHAGTVPALPAILDGLHQRGLRAVTTSELLS